MAKILLGIALAVMIATAALGYLTKGNIDKLQSKLADTKSTLATTETTLSKTKKDLSTRTDELAAANTKIDERDKEIATQKGQLDDVTAKLTAATASVADLTAKAADLQDKLNKIINSSTGPVDPEALAKQVADLKENLTKAQAEAAESKSLVEALTQQKKTVEDNLAVLETYKKDRERTVARTGLTGRILAVNPGWNFLVLSVGDKQGAVMNAPMLIVREGQPIAKARITSVEPTTSIADLLPGSVAKGVTVQPGDTVVFEGRNSVTQPSLAAPAPALPH